MIDRPHWLTDPLGRARSTGRRLLGSAGDRLLDATVALSFDRSGFERHARRFEPGALDVDLRGRTWLITGANSGIGRETSRALAARGATVVMICRSPERGEAAREALRAETGGDLRMAIIDVSRLDAVASLDRWLIRLGVDHIDGLVHNAGLLLPERRLTPDGLETTVATHLCGPLALTHAALSRLRPAARIIWVSSGGMYTRRLSVEALARASAPDRRFDGVRVYADTKRAQVVLAEQLAERLAGRAMVHAMHPGWADTPGVVKGLPRFHRVTERMLRTPAQGADTVVWLACSEVGGLSTGRFFFDRAERPTHLSVVTRESAAARAQLWSTVCRWSGLPPDAFDPA